METLGVLKEAVAKFGDGRFLIEEKKTFSYLDVDRLSNSLALSLRRMGVSKGGRVALYMNGASEQALLG